MENRRRFLKVIGGSVLALGGVPLTEGCSGTGDSSGTGGGGGSSPSSGSSGSSGSGMGGAGGAESSSSSSSESSSQSSSGNGCGPETGVNAGMPSQYTTDGLHKVAGAKVLIGRDAGGLYALSSICTHLSCNMNQQGSVKPYGMLCGCHGSQFDVVGNVLQGPAMTALSAYALVLGCDGNLYVDTKTKVDNTVRLKA